MKSLPYMTWCCALFVCIIVAGCQTEGSDGNADGSAQPDVADDGENGDGGSVQLQECGYSDPGIELPPCPEGFYCSSTPGLCPDNFPLAGTFVGVCVPVPEECPEETDEVCDCDGVTYDNECLARQARALVFFHDRCDSTCTTNDDCGSTAFCGNTLGSEHSEWCVVEDNGRCLDFSPLCELFGSLEGTSQDGDGGGDSRVCGCDGETYEHVCSAALEGRTNIAHHAPCDDEAYEDAGVQ
jgi:hypothetical protein